MLLFIKHLLRNFLIIFMIQFVYRRKGIGIFQSKHLKVSFCGLVIFSYWEKDKIGKIFIGFNVS